MMGLSIRITRNGALEKTAQLDPGEYTIGRERCDIIIDHGSVSKNHAKLSVSSDSATITDAGSLNGTYCHGERIENRTFDDGFEVEIGPFLLKGALEKRDKGARQGILSGHKFAPSILERSSILRVFSIRKLVSLDIRLTVFLCLTLLMVMTFAALYFPLKGQVRDFQRLELIKRGIIFARYLSEMNKYAVGEGRYDLITLDPVSMEKGVAYSFVVDVSGKIIAPVEKTGEMLELPGLDIAIKEGLLKITEGEKNEKIIVCPIKSLNNTIGAAIIEYDTKRAGDINEPDVKGYSFMVFFLLLVVCGAIGTFLIRIFVKPLQALEEDIGVALKEAKDHIEFDSPYREIENLVGVFNRLLMRVPIQQAAPPVVPGDGNIRDVGDLAEGKSPSLLSELDRITSPWCIVDREDFVIIQYNKPFIELIGNTDIKQGVHVVEAFENPEIVNAIFLLIDRPEAEGSVPVHNGKMAEIRKMSIEGEENKLVFVFEASANG